MIFKLLFTALTATLTYGRIYNLQTFNDTRKDIALSTFGFYKSGLLSVQLQNFVARPSKKSDVFGFSLYYTLDGVITRNSDASQDYCILQKEIQTVHDPVLAYFILDLNYEFLQIKCNSRGHQTLDIYENLGSIPVTSKVPAACEIIALSFVSFTKANQTYYNTSFTMHVGSEAQEGLYNLYFHSCPNYVLDSQVTYDFSIVITEENAGGNYLSAGEMPLPAFYSIIAAVFFLSACFWAFILKQSRHPVLKVHYFMTVLIFLKVITLAIQTVNFTFIELEGLSSTSWVLLFYAVRLLEDLVLFTTLLLIAIGWTLLKSVLDIRDKALLMIVAAAQVLVNVAEIIAEKRDGEYIMWRYIFILADVFRCSCILLPGIWSILHVRKASEVYGKAAVNLTKLFRYFYVMVVCYFYFTRVFSYLLKITLPFQYSWTEKVFPEVVTYIIFVFLGYKFRPAALNPYLAVPSNEM